MAVSKRLRYEILRRDDYTCRYCGAKAPDAPLRVDHVTPVALGGGDEPSNLVTACEACNSGKSSASPDATIVAGVADDALRWAAAMQKAAEDLCEQQKPKLAYRGAFQQAWGEWTWERAGKREPFDLPQGWKSSLDNFQQAGLPQEVWPDIVEKAMTNKTVKADNLFRYCCGIAWRMVRELQDRARLIVGADQAEPAITDSVVQAAVDVWLHEQFIEIDSQRREEFRASASEARGDEDAHRIVEGAQYAAWYGENDIRAALTKLDRGECLEAWTFAWLAKTGEWPDEERTEDIRAQCDALLAADVHVSRVKRAATYAGSRRSGHLYFGLDERELVEIKKSDVMIRAAEVWVEAFHASADRWPSRLETGAFFGSLRRIGNDGDIWISDIYPAATAAGAYQDPDMSRCLPRHLSVFEAAAKPLAPAA